MATPSGEQSAAEAPTIVGERLTVADIATGATVRIVAAKEGSGFAAETVQLMAAVQAGQSGQAS